MDCSQTKPPLKVYDLSDLDTAFPNSSSLRLRVQYENGDEDCVTTNLSLDLFKKTYMNSLVRRSYYNKDYCAPICRVFNIIPQ